MQSVQIIYLVFFLAGITSFKRLRPPVAVLACVLGGWALLPVGLYPPPPEGANESGLPIWIIGLALPSQMMLTKAWVGPLAATLGMLLFDRAAFLTYLRRLSWVDLLPLLWCCSPLLSALRHEPAPPPWLAVPYLLGSWGLPWILGRTYFVSPEPRRTLAWGFVWAAAAYLPFSLLESFTGSWVYAAVYQTPHPFRDIGSERYLGHRPVGFLEDGNQLGMWLAGAALLATWLTLTSPSKRPWPLAALLVLMTLAAQSVGAIALLLLGLSLLALSRWISLRWVTLLLGGLLVLSLGAYLSGKVPVEAMYKKRTLGVQKLYMAFKSSGRGSLPWRISQDQKVLKTALAHPLTGSGTWNWWQQNGTRPWGLELLVLGQYGALGLLSVYGLLSVGLLRVGWTLRRGDPWKSAPVAAALAMLLFITIIDSLLNSFVILPTILAAGALADPKTAPSPLLPESVAPKP